MNVLVACEESQTVCKAFRERGHIAYSCDIQECSGGHPEWHICGDVLPILNGNCAFITENMESHEIDGLWDIVIAHPPCTYLTVTGNRWFSIERYGDAAKQRYRDRYAAIVFFMQCVSTAANIGVAVENPIGIMGTCYRKPDQIIQPYEYGHDTRKSTCLWLNGLPGLIPTNIVDPVIKGKGFSGACYYATDENGKILSWKDPRTAKARSKTFPGIAAAMAEQWGGISSIEL